MTRSNQTLYLKVWGDNACFTRPEMKVERVSYDVMTPSAARGILEAILWKPSIRWIIQQIDVLQPIRWQSIRRNEISNIISSRNIMSAMTNGQGALHLYIEDDRQQRASLCLREVAYTIHATYELTAKARPEDSLGKYWDMFTRRASKGQCFTQPYLGCREFAANFELIETKAELPPTITDSRDLGWMLHDLDYTSETPQPYFFRAQMEKGAIKIPYPKSSEVKA